MNIKISSLVSKLKMTMSSPVARGTTLLLTGSVIGKSVGILTMPIISRIYTPEDFGVASLFTSVSLLISPFLTLRYVSAIPLPQKDYIAVNLLVVNFILIGILSSLIIIALALIGEDILIALSLDVLLKWMWLLPVAMVLTATYEVLSTYAARQRSYGILARSNVSQSISGALTKLVFGSLVHGPIGLLLGQIVSQGGGVSRLALIATRDVIHHYRRIRLRSMKVIIVRWRSFPQWRLPSQFLLIISQQVPVFFIANKFGTSLAGQLGLAQMAIAIPVTLIASNTAKVFYSEAARLGCRNPAEIRTMAREVIIKLFLMGIAPTLILLTFGESIFEIAFGGKWSQAGAFAAILSVSILFQFVQMPTSHIFYIFNGNKVLLILNAQRLILAIGTFGLLSFLGSKVETMLWWYSIVISIHYAVSIITSYNYISRKA